MVLDIAPTLYMYDKTDMKFVSDQLMAQDNTDYVETGGRVLALVLLDSAQSGTGESRKCDETGPS